MELPAEWPAFAAAAAAAGLVQGSLGFGFSLVTLTGAAFFLPLDVVVPAVAVLSAVIYTGQLTVMRDSLVLKDGLVIVAGMLMGVPGGVALLRFGEPKWLLAALGLVLVLGSASQAMRRGERVERGRKVAFVAGLAGGVLSGSLGTGGPPVVLYTQTQPWKPARMAAVLVFAFLSSTLATLVGYSVSGMLGRTSGMLALVGAPVAALGWVIGFRIFSALPEAAFRSIVQASLAVVGVWYVVRAFA